MHIRDGKTYLLRIILEKDAVQLERALLIHELEEAMTWKFYSGISGCPKMW